jgi:hypothetical protein
MARLEAWAAWFFSCLGTVLLGVSVLVVPADAFADGGSCSYYDCYMKCSGNQACIDTCAVECCADFCEGKGEECWGTCCSSACGGSGNSCYDNCVAQGKSDCTDKSKCTPCNFPCDDVCFGSGSCGPNFCICNKASGSKCKCDPK